MPELTPEVERALNEAHQHAADLKAQLSSLHQQTDYEDLDHAVLGLDIVQHAIGEVLEHTGLGGEIVRVSDPEAHRLADGWRTDVERITTEASVLLATHENEDLETAIKALTVAQGSLEEVAERYE